jgi:DHA1 family multidrug resistance protein-like MFS transporter
MIGNFQARLLRLESWQQNLGIIFFAQMCSAVGFSMIFPFLPLYVEDLGTNTSISIEFWAGMVFSAQAFTMMIASPIWGALADRYGRKLMVQRAMFGAMVTIFLMAFAHTAEQLVLLRAIQGLITGTVSAANALVAASAPRKHSGFAMGVVQVGLWSGVALGPLIGGILADAYGFRVPFLITAGLQFVAFILVWVGVHEDFTPETRSANQNKSFITEWRHVFTMDGVLQTYIIRFLAGLSRSLIIPIMPLFIVLLFTSRSAGVPLPEFLEGFIEPAGVSTYTGLVVGVSSATSTLSAVYLGRLGDRIGHRRILIGSALVAMLLYIPQGFVAFAWQLLILQGLTGLAIGGLVAAPSALLARYTDPGEEGAVYGLDNSVVAGARAVAPLIASGVAIWFGLRMMFVAMPLVFLIIGLIAMLVLPADPLTHTGKSAHEENAQLEPQPSAGD